MSKKTSKKCQKNSHGKRSVSAKSKPREIYFPSLANEELPRATIEKRKRNLKSLRWADECGYDICILDPLVGIYRIDESVYQDYNSQEDGSPRNGPSRNDHMVERKKKKRNRSKKSRGAADKKVKGEKNDEADVEDKQKRSAKFKESQEQGTDLSDRESSDSSSKPGLKLDVECSNILNQMKGQWPPEQLEDLVAAMKNSREKFELQLEEAIRLLRISRKRSQKGMREAESVEIEMKAWHVLAVCYSLSKDVDDERRALVAAIKLARSLMSSEYGECDCLSEQCIASMLLQLGRTFFSNSKTEVGVATKLLKYCRPYLTGVRAIEAARLQAIAELASHGNSAADNPVEKQDPEAMLRKALAAARAIDCSKEIRLCSLALETAGQISKTSSLPQHLVDCSHVLTQICTAV